MPDALDLDSVAAGGKAAVAGALTRLEREAESAAIVGLLRQAYRRPRAHVVGITGPPGVGKSTLMSALIAGWRRQGRTVAVIAVDPSSRRSGGALLGDRTRLATDPEDGGVFVRSMAARDRLGGLAEAASAAMVLLRALFDVVLIETVGVGQSESDVVGVADTVIFCVQPGSGDSLQYMKAGIVEIPHLVVVTKADMGAAAARAAADVEGALGLAAPRDGWRVPVLTVSSLGGEGVADLLAAIEAHWRYLGEDGGRRLAAARLCQAEDWLADAVRERFGRHGLRRAGPLRLAADESPFDRLAVITTELETRT